MNTQQTKQQLHTQGWERGANFGGLCGIKNESGRFIARDVESDAADLIIQAVNERQALLDSHSELLAALLRAKTDIYNLANGINGKRYVLDMISDIDTVTNKIAKK